MDVVLRTSYGEAEISLRAVGDESTLADVLEHVTGQTSPPIVFIDGRALPATTRLSASGLLYGSTIATSEEETNSENGVVELVQIAGPGAGATASIAAGHYVLGSGRRASARELDLAPVDHPSFELTIGDDSAVKTRARSNTIRVDGRDIKSGDTTKWSTGTLDSGDRVFQLNRRAVHTSGRRIRPRASEGRSTVAFNRPPRPTRPPGADPIASSDKETIVGYHAAERDRRRSEQPHLGDLLRLARDLDSKLWERRPGDVDAFRIAIGLADAAWSPMLGTPQNDSIEVHQFVDACGPLPMVPVAVDLMTERGIAVVGNHSVASEIARGLMLEAAITHGPADLDIVVLTSSDRMPEWEWAKWLPHTRTRGAPQILLSEEEARDWIAEVQQDREEVSAEQSTPEHLTLVVVDNDALWRERDSPLRPLFSERQSSLRALVLAEETSGAPAICSVVISTNGNSVVTADFVAEGRKVGGIRPFRASVDISLSVALALAPLDDPELPPDAESGLPRTLSLADLVEHGPHGLIVGDGAGDMAQTMIVSLARNHAADSLNFALLGFTSGGTIDVFRPLPHTTLIESDLDKQRAARILACLSSEVRRRKADAAETGSSAPRLVLVILDADAAVTRVPDFLAEIVEVAQDGQDLGLHLVVAAERSDSIEPAINAALDFQVVLSDSPNLLQPFRSGPVVHQAGDRNALDIVPFVVGRELSPMEHRLVRTVNSVADSEGDAPVSASSELAEIVKAISESKAANGGPAQRILCPDQLPDRLPIRSFFDEHPGDAVPYALVDIPGEQSQEPAWWRPEPGNNLVISGGRGSGKTSLLLSLAIGVGERFAADDVQLFCVDAGGGQLEPLSQLPHTGFVTRLDDPGRAVQDVQNLVKEVSRRSALAEASSDTEPITEPTIVVLIDNVAALRTALEPEHGWSAFEQMINEGRPLGICTVVTANDPHEVPPSFTRDDADVIVRLDDPADCVGRAHREGDGAELQIVAPPEDVAAVIADLDAEAPNERPPLGGLS